MLKKETFVNALLNIKKQSEKVDKFSSAIEAVSDGFIVCDFFISVVLVTQFI